MLLKIVCLLMCWLFSLAVLVIRGGGEKDAELLVLLCRSNTRLSG
ncbi:MAG TPA: hypothetical protein VMU94_01435 [Streptosporangiaceae bacterium]|nr:hypothetical protein [Streptosporangiaceae bacterium]